MADNRKMIAAGVVLVGVLLVMTACARSETSFKFHPALGICDAEEELYEAKIRCRNWIRNMEVPRWNMLSGRMDSFM